MRSLERSLPVGGLIADGVSGFELRCVFDKVSSGIEREATPRRISIAGGGAKAMQHSF
jgi:hypothetical protein